MTDKQKRFADEYIIDSNATRAYRIAYPSCKKDETAWSNGYRLLRKAEVKDYIAERLQEIASNKIATAIEVMEYLTSVMRGEETDEKLSEAGTLELRVATKDRLKAGELLAKRFGLDKPQEDNEQLQKLDEILSTIKGGA